MTLPTTSLAQWKITMNTLENENESVTLTPILTLSMTCLKIFIFYTFIFGFIYFQVAQPVLYCNLSANGSWVRSCQGNKILYIFSVKLYPRLYISTLASVTRGGNYRDKKPQDPQLYFGYWGLFMPPSIKVEPHIECNYWPCRKKFGHRAKKVGS